MQKSKLSESIESVDVFPNKHPPKKKIWLTSRHWLDLTLGHIFHDSIDLPLINFTTSANLQNIIVIQHTCVARLHINYHQTLTLG